MAKRGIDAIPLATAEKMASKNRDVADIIQLLPEAVANQIAAGEVVQRPASVVKELMENSIDAGSTKIQLIVKDSGKTLIQVIDNGKGMSETDARMSFERHATSKIKKSEDLFHIMTKGFRGEALASIAAVAQVELRTKQKGEQLGSQVENEGSKLKRHEAIQCPEGTNFQVKNLFFNVPARRYFLKSDSIELKHIIDEFQRLALTHADIEFSFTHNGAEVFNLPIAPLRQRIVHVFGNKYNEKLVPVDEETAIVNVSGFIGKPDAAKKTRGEQFFFVNNRFIRNSYLHHAVSSAFEALLPAGNFPLYLLYLTIDPEQIDINIHPTKTEIKFQDERAIYAILHAAVRRALGRFNISPSLDFEQETSIPISPVRSDDQILPPRVNINTEYNPFESKPKKESSLAGWFDRREKTSDGWKELYAINQQMDQRQGFDVEVNVPEAPSHEVIAYDEEVIPFQLHRKFIACQSRDGLMLIDQQAAHQRILFERYIARMNEGQSSVQQLLFPETVTLAPSDFALLSGVLGEVRALGFDIEEFGGTSFQILGIPSEAGVVNGQQLVEDFVELIKNESAVKQPSREKMAWALARSTSVKQGQMLTAPEMKELVEKLFDCEMPYFAEGKRSTIVTLSLAQLEQQFK